MGGFSAASALEMYLQTEGWKNIHLSKYMLVFIKTQGKNPQIGTRELRLTLQFRPGVRKEYHVPTSPFVQNN